MAVYFSYVMESNYVLKVTITSGTYEHLAIAANFGAVDKTSSSFSAHGKIGNFIIIIIIQQDAAGEVGVQFQLTWLSSVRRSGRKAKDHHSDDVVASTLQLCAIYTLHYLSHAGHSKRNEHAKKLSQAPVSTHYSTVNWRPVSIVAAGG